MRYEMKETAIARTLFALALSLSVAAAACAPSEEAPGTDRGRGSAGAADGFVHGSCRDACGGRALDGSCYCDEMCGYYGDCCSDEDALCSSEPVAEAVYVLGAPGRDCDEVCGALGRECGGLGSVGGDCSAYSGSAGCSEPDSWIYSERWDACFSDWGTCEVCSLNYNLYNRFCCRCALAPACTPGTCEEAGAECGPADDGCGGTLECGPCEAPDTCGGGGEPGRCGCTPAPCEADACGLMDDGCGGEVDCGECPDDLGAFPDGWTAGSTYAGTLTAPSVRECSGSDRATLSCSDRVPGQVTCEVDVSRSEIRCGHSYYGIPWRRIGADGGFSYADSMGYSVREAVSFAGRVGSDGRVALDSYSVETTTLLSTGGVYITRVEIRDAAGTLVARR